MQVSDADRARAPGPATGTLSRVLMLTPDVYYLDRRIVQEAGTLAARGSAVDIYLTNPAFAPGDPALPAGVRILRNPAAARPASGVPLRLRYLKARLRETAPPLHRLADWAQHTATDRAEGIARANMDILAAQPPYRLVVGHDVPVWPLAARLAARWECLLVVDLHDIYPEMEESFSSASARRYWRSVEARWIMEVDAILCVNEAVSEYVRDRYAPSAERFVVTNAVPFVASPVPSQDRLRGEYGIPAETKVLLFAGVPRPNMNLENLVLGFESAALDGWALAFLGVGPATRGLVRLVKSRALERRVFIGLSVPQAELVPTASTATAGALPYQAVGYNHIIATPNKLFEYIQARLPVIASPLPMVKRIVEDHGIGGFADFSTPEAAAEGIRTFVETTLPTITPDAREAAARAICWEAQEATVIAGVEAAERHHHDANSERGRDP